MIAHGGTPVPEGEGRAGARYAEEDTRASTRPTEWDLRHRYQAYRRRHAGRLLSLIPRSAVRPLYRAALEGEGASGEGIELLTEYCAGLLPLPPFEVWVEDFLAHPAVYMDDRATWEGLDPDGCRTVDVRPFDTGDRRWTVALNVVRHGPEAWGGHLAFETEGRRGAVRTGDIFRESCASAVRSRFHEFDDRTLAAFLRSSLP